MEMRIEPLANHRHRIQEIASLLHAEWGNLPPWSSPSRIADRLMAASAGQVFPIAFIALTADQQLLGTASLKLYELPDHLDKEHWLAEVFVPTKLRGQGIGSALISAGKEYAVKAGVPALYLYTPDQQALYHRHGWIQIEKTAVNGEEVTIMAWKTHCKDNNHSP